MENIYSFGSFQFHKKSTPYFSNLVLGLLLLELSVGLVSVLVDLSKGKERGEK